MSPHLEDGNHVHEEQNATAGVSRLSEEIIRLIRMGPRFRGMLKTGDLGAEFSALMLLLPLRAMGPMRVTDLADLKQADPSTISRQVAQLVKAGLARREADPADGRASRLAVTEDGVAACERLRTARTALLERALSDWPAARVDTFAQLFEEFNSSVEALLRTDLGAPPRENA
ncbi:MarR family winged helix-turn-helix transcriptional regulator [Actinoplanes ianthinogenes]|uniref:MarR family winged helix-turn-helix transcriptional regulator n=1 Tax=Actinoplanes ianthinogenes TaxID=122358 RepID=UPI001E327D3E|nr:MarR family transcriptional regulator [Actinoplanes ianthinogenes]